MPACFQLPWSRVYRRFLNDCMSCTAEKKIFLSAYGWEKSRDKIFSNIRSQSENYSADNFWKVFRRVTTIRGKDLSSFNKFSFHNNEARMIKGLKMTVPKTHHLFPHFQMGFLKRDRLWKIISVTIQKMLIECTDSKKGFFRIWTLKRKLLRLSVGLLALRNVIYLVFDSFFTVQDFLLRLLVLPHPSVVYRLLIVELRDLLDRSDCSKLPTSDRNGKGGPSNRLITVCLKCISTEDSNYAELKLKKDGDTITRPTTCGKSATYFDVFEVKDPFQNFSNLNLLGHNQKE